MAHNIFGYSITADTLMALPEYRERGREMITPRELAKIALHSKNDNEKNDKARKYVEERKKKWGRGTGTLCLIYNATGGTITLKSHHDWCGHIGPTPYPVMLANGQWGAFLHVRSTLSFQGSCGAVMYQGKNGDGVSCEWFAAWNNPWNRWANDNQVVAYVSEEKPNTNWLVVYGFFGDTAKLHHSYSHIGCNATVATGNDKRPFVEAVFTLDNLN